MLFLSLMMASLSLIQLIYLFYTQSKLKQVSLKNRDNIASVAREIKDKYSKINIRISIVLFILVSIFNIYSVLGGNEMKKEFIVNISEHFNLFKKEEIKPLDERIALIEDVIFPSTGGGLGVQVILIEKRVKEIEDKLFMIQESINEDAIRLKELSEIKSELENIKRVLRTTGNRAKYMNTTQR